MRRYALLWGVLSSLGLSACAHDLGGKPGKPVELPKECRQGPFCVTGQIDDQFGQPVEGVRCFVVDAQGAAHETQSDARGFFYLDGLVALPKDVRFAKAHFEPATQPVPPRGQGEASPVYGVMQRQPDEGGGPGR